MGYSIQGETPPADWENPNWNSEQRVHNWRNYVPIELKLCWTTFTLDQRELLAKAFENCANNEEWE